jgi:site-specific recombinase XerD
VSDYRGGNVLLVSKGKGDKQRRVMMGEYAQDAWKVYLPKRQRILRK